MKVNISNLTLSYGSFTAIRNLNLDIADGESIVLLGQSGCGKTSTMRCVAGLEQPDTGVISIGDSEVFNSATNKNIAANKRNVGLVFQSYAVWPHLTVLENVSFPLQMKKLSRVEVRRRALEMLELVGLAHLADKGASLLSGGQMQRVALARSLAMEPNVMLLDEPLSNLDARLRDDLRVELRRLQMELGLTSIYVTHDQSEALALADRIAIMRDGQIAQLDTPVNIYKNPATSGIASFLGVSNVFPIADKPVSAGRVSLAEHPVEVAASGFIPTDGALSVCLRPEDLELAHMHDPHADNSWPGTVDVAVFQGSHVRRSVQLDNGPTVEILSHREGMDSFGRGDRTWVQVQAHHVQILPSVKG